MSGFRKIARWIGIIGCIIVIIGCFLPFATVTYYGLSQTTSLWSIKPLGAIIVGAAVISALIMLTKRAKLSLITSIIMALLIGINIMNASEVSEAFTYEIGMYVTIAGLIIAIILPLFVKKAK